MVTSQTSYTLDDNNDNLTLTGGGAQSVKLSNGHQALVYGTPSIWANYIDYYQGDNTAGYLGVCGLVSCENVLIQTGILTTKDGYSPNSTKTDDLESTIVNYAINNDLCDTTGSSEKKGGTLPDQLATLLTDYGINATEYYATLQEIAQYIQDNKCVIAGVDAYILHGDEELSTPKLNHAITITGVAYKAVSDTGEIEGFYICDSGRGRKSDAARFVPSALMIKALSADGIYDYYDIVVTDDPIKLYLDNINGTGNSNANSLTGNLGNNILTGNEGDDTLDGGGGKDTLYGGIGNDTYYVHQYSRVIEYANQGNNDCVITDYDYTLDKFIENLTLSGTSTVNGTGNDLNNVITGNEYNSIIDGGKGADTMNGGANNDTYYVDNTADVIIDSSGTDTVYSLVSYTLDSNLENVTLLGNKALNYTGNSSANILTGNSAVNTLDGNAGNDALYGLGGNDNLTGGDGTDILYGGTGNDNYYIDSSDTIAESYIEGTDTVYISSSYTLSDNVENLVLNDVAINGIGNTQINTIIGNSSNNYLDGSYGNDILTGNAGNDTLIGGIGTDKMYGGSGDDIYYVDNSKDLTVEKSAEETDIVYSTVSYTLSAEIENITLQGASSINATGNKSDNTITGNTGSNILTGSTGNDYIEGNAGNDKLLGGVGNDTLDCGIGNDTLIGDAGSDTYLFDIGDGKDSITEVKFKIPEEDIISFGASVIRDDIAFFMQGANLLIDYGSSVGTEQITILNVNKKSQDYGIEKIQTNDGYYLTKAQINSIIGDITQYDSDHSDITITGINIVKSDTDLMNIIAGYWTNS